MNFLPVATRELRMTATRPGTYYGRAVAALAAALISLGMVYAGFAGLMTPTAAGRGAFSALACIGYILVLVEGALLTADSISREKREGTLPLLLMADLSGYDVVAGKLVSRMNRSVQWLLAALPALSFSMFMGGVTLWQVLAMTAALFVALVFAASLGLLVSAFTQRESRAIAGALIAVLTPAVGLPLLALSLSTATKKIGPKFLLAGPSGLFLSAANLGPVGASAGNFFGFLFVSLLVSLFALVLAGFVVARPTFELGTSGRFVFRWPTRPRKQAANELEMGPVAGTMMCGPGDDTFWRMLWLVGITVAVVTGAIIVSRRNWFSLVTFVVLGLLLHTVLKFVVSERACRAVFRSRQTGELELLLTTPLDEHDILRGAVRSLKQELTWPVLYVLVVDAMLVVAGCSQLWKAGLWVAAGWTFGCGLEVAWLLGQLVALSAVGVFMGMKSASAIQALRRTILYVWLMPWLGLLALFALFSIVAGRFISPIMTPLIPILLFLFTLVLSNIGFSGWAMGELSDNFRTLAANQLTPGINRRERRQQRTRRQRLRQSY